MTTIASITAIILVLHGLLLMLGGIAMEMDTVIRSGQRIAVAGSSGLLGLIIGSLLAALILVKGLIMFASGEGVSLLSALMRRMPPT